ncbi:hypothetical protein AB8613_20930 [Vibrio sp. BS-M-Sm-2]|uniref:hypothetical protein n=1 Tax=Vibrio sp. BS-M-Sm-2 TaxID=3241167 RepID=UPI003558F5F7
MRFIIIIILTLDIIAAMLSFIVYYSKYDITGPLWEIDEVILSQNVDIGTKENAKFHLVKAKFTLLYFSDGKFTASITAETDYKNGLKESVTQEFMGSWVRQGEYIDMRIDDSHSIMGYPDDQTLVDRIDYYARIALDQSYIVNYYKGRLVLISSHAGGPMLTLFPTSV